MSCQRVVIFVILQWYRVATKPYLSRGKDGYTVFQKCEQLVSRGAVGLALMFAFMFVCIAQFYRVATKVYLQQGKDGGSPAQHPDPGAHGDGEKG